MIVTETENKRQRDEKNQGEESVRGPFFSTETELLRKKCFRLVRNTVFVFLGFLKASSSAKDCARSAVYDNAHIFWHPKPQQ